MTHEQYVRKALDDWERWRAWFRPLCGKVSRIWLSPALYRRFELALLMYREGHDRQVPWREALTVYGVRVEKRSQRDKPRRRKG
jgi:hypothetical protein